MQPWEGDPSSWTGKIRVVLLVILVLAFCNLAGSGWSSNWFSIFRQLDEKTQAWAEVGDQVGCLWLPPGPGVSEEILLICRQAKRSASPSNPSHGLCGFHGGGRNLWGSHSASNKKMAAVACFSGGRNLFPLEQENLHIFFWGGTQGL